MSNQLESNIPSDAATCSRVAVVMRDGPQCYLHRPPCGCCDEWTDRPWKATPLAPEEAESLINDKYRRIAGIRAIIYPANSVFMHDSATKTPDGPEA